MGLFLQSLTGGGLLGGTYALIGLGLVLAFRATRTFNFAHGELMLLPAFIVGYAQAHHDPLVPSIVVSLLFSGVLGVLFYVVVLRRTTGLDLFMSIIATFGLASILDGAMGIAFSTSQYDIVFSALPKGSVIIGGGGVSKSALTVGGFAIVLALVVAATIRFTHLGTKVRACGQDAVLASQSGINVRRVYMGSWAVAAVLAGVAGITYGSTAVVNTSMVDLALAAIPAMVLGGMDSIEGAVIGGIVIGAVQGLTQTYLGGTYIDAIIYGLLLVILLLAPQGLLGTKSVVRA